MARLPVTTAQLRVLHQSFSQRLLEGEVSAGGFQWTFRWAFDRGELSVEPSLGRALIQDALLRFCSRWTISWSPAATTPLRCGPSSKHRLELPLEPVAQLALQQQLGGDVIQVPGRHP